MSILQQKRYRYGRVSFSLYCMSNVSIKFKQFFLCFDTILFIFIKIFICCVKFLLVSSNMSFSFAYRVR